VIRRILVIVTAAASIAILGAAAGPAGAAGAAAVGPRTPASATPPLARPGTIRAGLKVQMTPAQANRAARRCASWAGKAGFANNGRGGHLVTAIAIAMAESGCNAGACYNDTTRRNCTRSGTSRSRDSIDRGAWQINSHYWKNVSDRCAYSGLCSARSAYRLVSAYGTYFKPWRTYLTGIYRRYLPQARAAVRALRTGTLTTAYIGSCAAHPAEHRHAKARLANCGSAARNQMWTRSAARLRTRRGLCLGAKFRRSGPVILQRCSGRWRQQWWPRAGFMLYNRGARKCLTDPGGSIRPGHALSVGRCRRQKDKVWYLP
jgi:hypothetical protein